MCVQNLAYLVSHRNIHYQKWINFINTKTSSSITVPFHEIQSRVPLAQVQSSTELQFLVRMVVTSMGETNEQKQKLNSKMLF